MSDFWSRRRAAVEAETIAETASEAAARAAEEDARQEAQSDEELLAEAGLPDPDMLETPDQVQAFLKSALPQRLKTRALRKLWGMNPILANVDGLVDYGEDYTDAALVVENMQTLYQVGKGMLDRFAEAAEAEDEAETPEAETGAETGAETEGAPSAADDPIVAEAPEDAPPIALVEADPPPADPIVSDLPAAAPEPLAAAPRRMRFHFET